MNGYDFTERVRKVLALARKEAAWLHHEYTGPEHMLLALIEEGGGVAATVLDGKQMGFEVVLLVDAVRGINGTSARLRRAIDGMCRAGARVEQFDGVAHELEVAVPID